MVKAAGKKRQGRKEYCVGCSIHPRQECSRRTMMGRQRVRDEDEEQDEDECTPVRVAAQFKSLDLDLTEFSEVPAANKAWRADLIALSEHGERT
jgi:hypothetical protein